MAGPITQNVAARVHEACKDWPDGAEIPDVERVLRMLAKWRSHMLERTYLRFHGTTVHRGLFAGMTYMEGATEGSLISRLMGVYEAELHPHLEAFMAAGVDCLIDVGCAEGYYAVGLARRYPGLEVHAHDTSEDAQRACAELAARNGVSDRVQVGGAFGPQDFEAFAGRNVLVLVDTEGAEVDILDPALGPSLAGMKIIVETHDVFRAGANDTIRRRFEASHEIVEVRTRPKAFDPPPWLDNLSELDVLLATWEWRERATPWLVMTPR
jgi:precorrin-6B methylase 2